MTKSRWVRKHRSRIESYISLIAQEMNLANWEIALSPHEAPSEGQIHISSFRREAILFLRKPSNPDDFRNTVVHELLHLHFQPMENVLLDTVADLRKKPAAFQRLRFNAELETSICAMTKAWAPRLPLMKEN